MLFAAEQTASSFSHKALRTFWQQRELPKS